jgi:hypothetical protein
LLFERTYRIATFRIYNPTWKLLLFFVALLLSLVSAFFFGEGRAWAAGLHQVPQQGKMSNTGMQNMSAMGMLPVEQDSMGLPPAPGSLSQWEPPTRLPAPQPSTASQPQEGEHSGSLPTTSHRPTPISQQPSVGAFSPDPLPNAGEKQGGSLSPTPDPPNPSPRPDTSPQPPPPQGGQQGSRPPKPQPDPSPQQKPRVQSRPSPDYYYQEEGPTTSGEPIYVPVGNATSGVEPRLNSAPQYYYKTDSVPSADLTHAPLGNASSDSESTTMVVDKVGTLASPGDILAAPEGGYSWAQEQPAGALPSFTAQQSKLSNFMPGGFVPSGPLPPALLNAKALPAAATLADASKAAALRPLVVVPPLASRAASAQPISNWRALANGALHTALQTLYRDASYLWGALTWERDAPSSGRAEEPIRDGTQPSLPLIPPSGGSSFSFAGGGQGGTGGGDGSPLPLLLLGALVLSLIVSRPEGRRWRIFCVLPKPGSVLLGPLERPG